MNEEPTTAVVQRCLDALQGDAASEPLIRDLLERAVGRLRLLCASLLRRSYPRLTQPPLNLETDELLGGVVAGLLKALREVHPQTVRQFFALANRRKPTLRVDLTGLTAIDAAGRDCLAALHRQGAEFVAADCLTKAIAAEITHQCS